MGSEQAADYGNIFNKIINNILNPIIDIIAMREEQIARELDLELENINIL